MMTIVKILEEIEKTAGHKAKAKILTDNNTPELRDMLYGMYSKLQWQFEGMGTPPFKIPEKPTSTLEQELKNLKYFTKVWNMKARDKEVKFVDTLEKLSEEEGKILLRVIEKDKFQSINKPVIRIAFPNLIQEWH